MKLIIFLFVFIVVPSKILFSQDTVVVYFDKDWNEISNKDIAIYYRIAFVDSNDIWRVNDYFMSKQIQMSGAYNSKKLKVREGYFIYYYENGEIKSEGTYINDKLEGVWKFNYDNGAKESEGNYSANLAEGIWEHWHESGEKKAEGKYLNDKKEGVWNYWYTNGQLLCVENYLKGEITSVIGYFENGKNSFQGNYKKGLMQNEWTYWNVDGRVAFKGKYNNGYKDGEWIRYFPEGELKILFKKGELQGKNLGGIVINE